MILKKKKRERERERERAQEREREMSLFFSHTTFSSNNSMLGFKIQTIPEPRSQSSRIIHLERIVVFPTLVS